MCPSLTYGNIPIHFNTLKVKFRGRLNFSISSVLSRIQRFKQHSIPFYPLTSSLIAIKSEYQLNNISIFSGGSSELQIFGLLTRKKDSAWHIFSHKKRKCTSAAVAGTEITAVQSLFIQLIHVAPRTQPLRAPLAPPFPFPAVLICSYEQPGNTFE